MARPETPVGSYGSISTALIRPGVWEARTRAKVAPSKMRQVRKRAATKAKAIARLREHLASLADTHGALAPATKVEVVAERWIADIYASDRAINTKERYEYALRRYALPRFGKVPLRDVHPGDITRWLRDLSPGNRRIARTVLSGVMKAAVNDGAITVNPVAGALEIRTHRATPQRGPRALTTDELGALRDAIAEWESKTTNGVRLRSIPLHDIVLMQLCSGTRIGEVLAIRWCDIDLSTGRLEVTGGLIMPKGGLQRSDTKTASGVRTLLLPQVATEMLRRMLNDLAPGTSETDSPVFAAPTGGYRWPHNVRRAWREARALAVVDLSWVKPHTFRKTAGTTVGEARGSIAGTKFLGQSDTRVFERAYLDRRATVDDHAALLNGMLEGWI